MTAVIDKGNAKEVVSRLLAKAKSEGRDSLTAPEAKELCDVYGIPVPQEGLAKTADDALDWQREAYDGPLTIPQAVNEPGAVSLSGLTN